ncbi:DUF2336 domain-containing protein [Alsobacter sp. SYSU M60028]|uniref:DUF2336 domain-containing protein n=1 Tax=Alsobacter ponti TaxID=2962936 RepID=A0ABT1LFU2_9HYPH|nr:DUF2336 domain-containing protein [Alsobacter ponti]MCP8940362.1 DUF2336 domain-containing protein [Alsobacter ponti]
MLVRRFLAWVDTAPAEARASAIAALARAYIAGDMEPEERGEAEKALTLMLDDPEPAVRRAMAVTLASSPEAPRHVASGLAADADGSVAAPVLAESPLLGEAELIERVATGDAAAQEAIASRARIAAPLAAAIAEVAEPSALARLAGNPGASILDFSLTRMAERAGGDPCVRAALEARGDLPVAAKHLLALQDAAGLGRDEVERATIDLARQSPATELRDFARHLRRSGQLTASLLLRGLIVGETRLFAHALAELSGQDARRVAGLMAEPGAEGFAALYAAAGLPESLRPAILASLSARRELDPDGLLDDPGIVRAIVARAAAEAADEDLLGLLHRLDADAARAEARLAAQALRDQQASAAQALLPPTSANEDEPLPASETAAEAAADDLPEADAATMPALEPEPLVAAEEAPARTGDSLYAALVERILAGRSWVAPSATSAVALDGEVLPAQAGGSGGDTPTPIWGPPFAGAEDEDAERKETLAA